MRRHTRNRMLVAVVTAGLACVIAVAGCGGGSESGTGDVASGHRKPQQGGTLHVSQGEEVVTLDPLVGYDYPSVNVDSQIFESLFKLNPEEKLEPWLVTKADMSTDHLEWTLHLRQGVSFSDGKPMTSADVLFTLETARKSANWEAQVEGIKAVSAPNPSTVVIKTAKPMAELPAILSQWSFGIVPKDYGGLSEKEFAEHPIGTGPFALGPWRHGESLTLEKNRDYWKSGLPYLDKIVFQAVPNAQSRVQQLTGGQLDVIYSPPWAEEESIENQPGLEVGQYSMGWCEEATLNLSSAVFKDRRMREALNLAVDREGMLSAIVNGHGEFAGSWIPPAIPYANHKIRQPAQNLTKARQLVKEAVSAGADPNLTLLVITADTFWGSAAQILQSNLEEVGFQVTIKSVDTASLGELESSGQFDAAVGGTYSAIPSPIELIGFYNGNDGAFTRAETAATSKLMDQATSQTNPEDRQRLWDRAQEAINDELGIVPIIYTPYSWALGEDVAGFEVASIGVPWFSNVGFVK